MKIGNLDAFRDVYRCRLKVMFRFSVLTKYVGLNKELEICTIIYEKLEIVCEDDDGPRFDHVKSKIELHVYSNHCF